MGLITYRWFGGLGIAMELLLLLLLLFSPSAAAHPAAHARPFAPLALHLANRYRHQNICVPFSHGNPFGSSLPRGLSCLSMQSLPGRATKSFRC